MALFRFQYRFPSCPEPRRGVRGRTYGLDAGPPAMGVLSFARAARASRLFGSLSCPTRRRGSPTRFGRPLLRSPPGRRGRGRKGSTQALAGKRAPLARPLATRHHHGGGETLAPHSIITGGSLPPRNQSPTWHPGEGYKRQIEVGLAKAWQVSNGPSAPEPASTGIHMRPQRREADPRTGAAASD